MIDITKWTLEDMWNEVIKKQEIGLKYHLEMIEIFSLIDMKGYMEWQKERYKDEFKTYIQTKIGYSKTFNKIYKPQEIKETLLKNIFLTSNKYTTDNKRAVINEIFSSWIEWEKSVNQLYMACIQWCINNQNDSYIFFSDLLKQVKKEQRSLMYHYSKLEDSKYNISDILEWQEYIYNKYK